MTGSPGSGPADFHAAWVAELDRLEVDVAQAEALLRAVAADPGVAISADPLPAGAHLEHDGSPGAAPAWAPPRMRAPLPADLEPRARLILERQLAVANLLAERLTITGRQRRLTQAFRDTAHPDVPVYVDLTS